MKHREYQVEALTACKAAFERGTLLQLIQLFTGGGKTVIFASIRKFFGFQKKILFLVHTDELASQAKEKLEVWNPGEGVSVEMGKEYADQSHNFIVGSVATLGRAGSTRLASFNPDEYAAVVVDEGHHITADSYQRILKHFGLCKEQDHQGRLLLAVTATTKRGDGEGLDKALDEIVYEFPMLRAIREGWQVNFKPYRVRTEVSLDNVKMVNGAFSVTELSLAVNTPKRNDEIVDKWLEVGENLKTIGFTVDIQHAQDLAQAFRDKGVNAEAVWGVDPERNRKLEEHRAGQILVLLNAALLVEGYDDPTVACVVLARPTGSQSMLEQMVGRGGRLPKGFNNLIEARESGTFIPKEYCVLIDVTDNTLRHKLSSVASLMGLPTKLDMRGMMLTDVLDTFQAIQDASPEVDLEGLEDLDNIQSYIESVDLFRVHFSPEVLEHSLLQWHKTPKGNYLLLLPNHEHITIIRNLLNTWTISGTVRGSTFQDTEHTVPEAIQRGDQMLKMLGRILIASVKRETASRIAKELCTAEQIAAIVIRLNKMKKGMPDFKKMTKHAADTLLTQLKGDRGT